MYKRASEIVNTVQEEKLIAELSNGYDEEEDIMNLNITQG